MTSKAILNVFLRQQRTYIQGTQVIARCAEVLDGTGWSLRQAQFNRITDHLLRVSKNLTETPHLGSVQFQRGGQAIDLYVEETDQRASSIDDPMPISIARRSTENSDGTVYDYHGANVFEDVLNVLVQAVKSEHEHRFDGAKDIWFTGLRNIDLQCKSLFEPNTGEVRMSLIRKMGRDGRHQTMWNLEIQPNGQAAAISGMITFAYKTDNDINAN